MPIITREESINNFVMMKKDKAVVDTNKEAYFKNGTNYVSYEFTLGDEDLSALKDGKTVALNIDDEYVVFIHC